MLKDSLYKIISLANRENIIEAILEINKNNKIFEGHFTGHPVLPGACMLQILKEVLESGLQRSFRLKKADSIKFLIPVDPGIDNILDLVMFCNLPDDKSIVVTATLSAQKNVCFKFKGTFIPL